MDRHAYEPFLQFCGTPIRCRSVEEVNTLIKDLCELFPKAIDRLQIIKEVYGSQGYETEVVYRIVKNQDGLLSANFCTFDFYKRHGYEVVDFSDILELNSENNNRWEAGSLTELLR